MRLFSYVITHDTGFAPNPFGGLLTLATCKPRIRLVAQPGDWLMGTGSATAIGSDRVVYAAQIKEVVPIATYGEDPRYSFKIPTLKGEPWRRHGDNIYALCSDGALKQRTNLHHREGDIARDTGGKNVLVCEFFYYFGNDAPRLPDRLIGLVKRGPGHRCDASPEQIDALVDWLSGFTPGVLGQPIITAPGGLASDRSTAQSDCTQQRRAITVMSSVRPCFPASSRSEGGNSAKC
jgi:hypothetical protein